MAKKFFYVCAGLFLLAASYHLGARTASAQVGAQVSGFVFDGRIYVMTPNGDVYAREYGGSPVAGSLDAAAPAWRLGNFWGGAVPTVETSWGALKVKAR